MHVTQRSRLKMARFSNIPCAMMTLLCEIKTLHLIKIVDFLCSVMPPSYLNYIVGGQAREARAREPRKNRTTEEESYKSRRFLLL